jgi:hypothetical protein
MAGFTSGPRQSRHARRHPHCPPGANFATPTPFPRRWLAQGVRPDAIMRGRTPRCYAKSATISASHPGPHRRGSQVPTARPRQLCLSRLHSRRGMHQHQRRLRMPLFQHDASRPVRHKIERRRNTGAEQGVLCVRLCFPRWVTTTGTTRILRCATACAALIIGPLTPCNGRLMTSKVALAHGVSGGSVGGGGDGGHPVSGIAADAEASGHASGAAHSRMENASHRGRAGCGGTYGQYGRARVSLQLRMSWALARSSVRASQSRAPAWPFWEWLPYGVECRIYLPGPDQVQRTLAACPSIVRSGAALCRKPMSYRPLG